MIAIVALLLAIMICLAILAGKLLNIRKLPVGMADAALVFGAGTEWKAESRCRTAAELFKNDVVREIIVSGGVQVRDTGLSEAQFFLERLNDLGVPGHLVTLEERATNTKENADFALELILERGFSSIVLVMSDFEGLRAHLTAAKSWNGQAIQIYDWHAPSTGHWSENWWWMSGEGWSLTWYAVSRIYRYGLWRYWRPGQNRLR